MVQLIRDIMVHLRDIMVHNFTRYNGPFTLFKKIRDGDLSLEMVEEDQKKFKSEFGQIISRNPDHKSDKQIR